MNLTLQAMNKEEARPIISFMTAPPRRNSDPLERYKQSTWQLLQTQLANILQAMAYFKDGQYITLHGQSRPSLVFLRLGMVNADLVEARMISGTPSNFAIACTTQLGSAVHPVPTVPVDAAAVNPATSTPDLKLDAEFENDAYDPDEEDDALSARVSCVDSRGEPVHFSYGIWMQAVQEVENRPPVRAVMISLFVRMCQCVFITIIMMLSRVVLPQCPPRDPAERRALLELHPLDDGKPIGPKRKAFRTKGWMPGVMSAFDEEAFAFLFGPFTIYQRLARDDLHMVCMRVC